MTPIRTLLTALALSFPAGLCATDPTAPKVRPNIIVILADDFGVGDIQAHYPNNKIVTPNLDRLVREGMSFTDAHSPSAVCSPTRYGLITGRYAWRTRLQEWVVAAYEPPLIDEHRATLPGFLREQGYHTAGMGKWHLGWNWPGPQKARMTAKPNGQKDLIWDFEKPVTGGPVDRGFDQFFGVDLPNLPPFTWIENDHVAIQPTAPLQVDPEEGIVLPMPGRHNVQNALAAVAVAIEMGCDDTVIRSGFAKFGGVRRRFTRVGEVAGATIIDDYAHHPVEIRAVLAAAREAAEGRVIAVVQPHRYTRLRDLMDEFQSAFNDADIVFAAPVYPAGEQPIEGVDAATLVAGLKARGHRAASAIAGPEELARLLADELTAGDMVVCLGAGDITRWAAGLAAATSACREARV